MNIIGLGKAGVAVATEFEKYSQYNVYKIDSDLEKAPRSLPLPSYATHEEAEEAALNLKSVFPRMKKDDTLFVLAGAGKASCASLAVLAHIRKKGKITILYIQPDLETLTERQKKAEKVVRNVLQEYARSGVFERIYLVSNPIIEEVLGGIPLSKYYETINETIVRSIHMINIYTNNKALHGDLGKTAETSRISTIGISEGKINKEKMFFSLDNVREVGYIYAINKEKIDKNPKLLNEIRKEIKSNKKEDTKVFSFEVHSTEYDKDYKYILKHTPHVQH